MSEHVILAENIHIGTNKVVIMLPLSKANRIPYTQRIIVTAQNTACPIQALTAYVLICPKRLGQFFIRLSGNPVLTQDIAAILSKMPKFLNLPHYLIKLHSLQIGGGGINTSLHNR